MSHSPVTASSTRRLRFAPALLAALATSNGLAQPPRTLDDIVAKLQDNLEQYERSIPSFLCDEQMDSISRQFAQRGASAANYETIAESVFRLKREIDPGSGAQTLNESREIKIIDGRPANGREIDAPAMVTGAFSGGLAMVSKDEQACMTYQMQPTKAHKPIVIRFASVPADQRPTDCILAEDGSGRVTVDPASMQISRIDVLVPHHVIEPIFSDGHAGPKTVTRWTVEVDYKPVVLDARTFWLPATIRSVSSSDDTQWSFLAIYRNYHKLEVRSRIVVPPAQPGP